jgi:hypothetical protein
MAPSASRLLTRHWSRRWIWSTRRSPPCMRREGGGCHGRASLLSLDPLPDLAPRRRSSWPWWEGGGLHGPTQGSGTAALATGFDTGGRERWGVAKRMALPFALLDLGPHVAALRVPRHQSSPKVPRAPVPRGSACRGVACRGSGRSPLP